MRLWRRYFGGCERDGVLLIECSTIDGVWCVMRTAVCASFECLMLRL